jgi:hypothetical protein
MVGTEDLVVTEAWVGLEAQPTVKVETVVKEDQAVRRTEVRVVTVVSRVVHLKLGYLSVVTEAVVVMVILAALAVQPTVASMAKLA